MLNLYVILSEIGNKESAEKEFSELVNNILSDNTNISMCGYFSKVDELKNEKANKAEFENASVILNSSGGTEALIEFIVVNTSKPVLILANSRKNSFASSLEAYAHLKEKYPLQTFYSDANSEIISVVDKFSRSVKAFEQINSAHFCLFGKPSDWLLTSKDFSGFGSFDTKYTQLDIEELVLKVDKISDGKTKEIINQWKSSFSEVLVEDKSLIDSAKVYIALKEIVNQKEIDVLSIRCFDLLKYNYTACMGLSICNDEGITAGCEGDLPTTFTMSIAQELSGQSIWMANPASVNKENNEITFAHCSVPQSFLASVNDSGLTTHMESGMSTAIRGPLNKTIVTILRISSDFKRLAVIKGEIIETDMRDMSLCRTQAVIRIESDVEKWIETTFGNHHVIVYGNILTELKYFCGFANIELIEL